MTKELLLTSQKKVKQETMRTFNSFSKETIQVNDNVSQAVKEKFTKQMFNDKNILATLELLSHV